MLLGINLNKDELEPEQKSTWKELKSIELMAILENEMKREDSGSSQTSTEDLPDYTQMFPDLYTVYSTPVKMDKGRKIASSTFDDGRARIL